MTKDFEPKDFQSNNHDSSHEDDHANNASDLNAEDTIEIKIGDRLLPKESYTDKPRTRMSAKQEFEEESVDDIPAPPPAKQSEPKTRMQRRQMEIRESLLANATSQAEPKEDVELSEHPQTREEKRKAELEEGKGSRKQKRQLKVRLIPVWLRLLILILLSLIAVVAGAMIGYGALGKGNPMDIFSMDTWNHIRDIVTKK